MYRTLCIACLLGFSATAVILDFRRRRIPNLLTLSAAFAGIGINVAWKGVPGLLFSLKGLALGLGILLVPFALHWIGGGDLKTLAALGSFGGPVLAWTAFLVGSTLAGMLAVILLLFFKLRKQAPAAASGVGPPVGPAVPKPTLPYGAMLSLGGCLILALQLTSLVTLSI